LTSILDEGSRLVQDRQLFRAIDVFTEAIELDPTWAEAWNKRATVFYMVGKFQKSQDDIDKVLELEKRHFGALAGQGMVNIKLRNYEKAILSYKKAQEIYPSMQSVEIMIKQIENLIKQDLI
jgi:tetratricopeptide (TPR) repeat protein